MSDVLTIVANYLFGWTVIILVLSWLLALGYPLFSRSLANCRVESASFFTLVYGLLPPIVATTALIFLSLPTLAFPFITDHCHGTNCTPHTLHMTTDTAEGIVTVTIAVTLLMSVFTFMLMQFFSGRRQLSALENLSDAGTKIYRVVDSRDHLAWCAGLLSPRVYLSSGLLNALTPRQVKIILTHELTHAIRKDNLRKWVLHWATIAWPNTKKIQIRQNLSSYNEQACDLATARITHDENAKVELISTLNAYNNGSDHSSESIAHISSQVRIASLNDALVLEDNQNVSSKLKPIAMIAIIWIVSAISALHFGHPLLEWLSQ